MGTTSGDAVVVLGVRCVPVGPSTVCGRVGRHMVVEADGSPERGWRVVQRDLVADRVIAFGVGLTREHAEADAQLDFVERMARDARRAA